MSLQSYMQRIHAACARLLSNVDRIFTAHLCNNDCAGSRLSNLDHTLHISTCVLEDLYIPDADAVHNAGCKNRPMYVAVSSHTVLNMSADK